MAVAISRAARVQAFADYVRAVGLQRGETARAAATRYPDASRGGRSLLKIYRASCSILT